MSEEMEPGGSNPQIGEAEDEASNNNNLSIMQVIDNMRSEFNKAEPKKNTDAGRKYNNRAESLARKQNHLLNKTTESKVTKLQKNTNHVDSEIKIIKENIPEKKAEKCSKDDDAANKQETSNKKEGNIPRIVLTFRTIDENTDNGKKTKISSCASNLSLVSDELLNCDQIGGVSVKIENFDEICNVSNSESDNQKQSPVKHNRSPNNKKDEIKEVRSEKSESPKKTSQENKKLDLESSDVKKDDSTVDVKNQTAIKESLSPNTRKGRLKRLREASDEGCLKRSARRLSKESLTVLESAMARKEKFNYTVENNTKRKYNRPGRPKKVVPDKKDNTPNVPNVPNVPTVPSVPIVPTVLTVSSTPNIPKLNPLDPTKFVLDKKDNLPKLTPLEPLKSKKDNLPKLSPLNPPKNISSKKTTFDSEEMITSSDDSKKANKYDGMPKLTPIVKSCEIVRSRVNAPATNGETIKSEMLIKPDKSFVKPASVKSKRDKGQPPPLVSSIRKKPKDGIFEESVPSPVPNLLDDIIIEDHPVESIIPTKKVRRGLAPSPCTAEGQASKPESTAILNNLIFDKSSIKKMDSLQCLCEVRSQLFVTITSQQSPLYCTALDSVDSRTVGCCNLVDHDDVAMRRPSAKIPFIILCRMHKERLIRHNCCPACGLFCSQGRFMHCTNGHQYHRQCELFYDNKSLCPHCASHGASFEVIISVTGKRKPIFVATRSEATKDPSAKMSLPGSGDNSRLAEQQPILEKCNEPLIDPQIIKIPDPTSASKTERYTFMSLYNAVKNNEIEKLVNVLANGFNANHAFRDQGQRTSLHIAADKGFLACVHILVQAGAQPDALDKNQLSALMLAAINGHTDVARYLMRVGADVTLKGEDGMTALHMAAKFGHLEVCKVILSECKVPRTLVDSVDDGGWTSLIWACEFRHADIARFLLSNKCDPLIRDAEQNIALHWSAFSGSSEITELLLNLGCDINAVNVHGDTPLHIAARQDQYAVTVLLLSRGAKVGETNVAGETAIDCCGGIGDTLTALQLNFTVNQNVDNMLERTVKILTNDISRGKESNPIQCVNGLDAEEKPTDFVYITENCFTGNRINVDRSISSLQSCRCEDNCSSDKCLCGNISLRCWYNDEGILVPEFNYTDPPMLFECNPACDCNRITCNNRVVQHGLTQRFQLFRTEGKGWGLRTLRLIPKGTYVCEYVGEIITDSEADQREDDSYLFDLDNRDGETFCIDARRYGNLARFINHSCAPNLLPVRVFIEHQDLRFPRIAFFANRDIDTDEELGFDYGEKFWIIKCKSFTCTCGAENCRYSDKTISITLDNYRKKLQQEEVNVVQVSSA